MNKQIILGVLSVLFFSESYAQIEVSSDIDFAIKSAIKKSLSIKNHLIENQKIELDKQEILFKYLPRIDASALAIHANTQTELDLKEKTIPIINKPIFDKSKTTDTYGNVVLGSVTAKQLLFSGLQIPYGLKALQWKLKGNQLLAESLNDDIIEDVITSFDQKQVLKALQKLIDESQKRLEVEKLRVEKAIDQGIAITMDRDKIKLAQLELESKQIELDGAKILIINKIKYLTDWNDNQIELAENQLMPFLFLKTDFFVQNKAEVKALNAFIKAQEYLVKKEKASYLPKVFAFGGISYTSIFDANISFNQPIMGLIPLNIGLNQFTISPNWFIGLGVKWELFDGFERSDKIKKAKLNVKITQNKLTDTQEKFKLLWQKNQQNYNIANQKLKINNQKVTLATNNLQKAIKQYEQGIIDISERLEIENDYYKAVVEQIKGIQEQRQKAIELIKTSGNLSNYIIKNN